MTEEEVQEAVDSIGECVLEDGAKVTEEQFSNEFCVFPASDEVVVFLVYDCDDGSTLYVAGEDQDDPNGGGARFEGPESTEWRYGAWGPEWESCYP